MNTSLRQRRAWSRLCLATAAVGVALFIFGNQRARAAVNDIANIFLIKAQENRQTSTDDPVPLPNSFLFKAGANSISLNSTTAPNGNIFVVINTNDSGTGSLRQAIIDSNNLPGTQTITFQIPGAGVHTIAPLTGLPPITSPVIIDGYTQPGASANTLPDDDDAVLLIELDGNAVINTSPGVDIVAGNSVVRGLVINRFGTNIRLRGNGGNVITGCFIGTDATGLAAPAGSGEGINFNIVNNNTIGGSNAAERNLISGNGSRGINIAGAGMGNIVQGNFIGTDRHGRGALGNNGQGITIGSGTVNTTIGGTNAGARNVVSGNVSWGISASGSGTTGTTIQGNFIGTDVTGTARLGNGAEGISLAGATSNTLIGGAAPGARNIICANVGNGITINTGSGFVVQGNFIGTDLTGTLDLGNGQNGMQVGTSNSTIGGTTPGEGNTIAFNGSGNGVVTSKNGVLIFGTGVSVLGNSIHSNIGLGIDLSPAYGVTPNDACDADTGANNLQNYPVVTSASPSGGNTIITGSLNSTANTQFRVEFFSSATCDAPPGGHGEGQTFLGSIVVTTNGNCTASINTTLPAPTTPGQVVTATATDPNGNTSEFSACQAVAGAAPPVITSPLVVTGTRDLPFTYQFTASGATSLAVSNLPPGFTFLMTPPPNPLPIAIVGKPTATGTFQVGLSATNSQGTTNATLTITVQQAPTSGPVIISSTAATGRVGQPFIFKVYTRGANPATARLSAAGLPPGLVVNAVPGVNGLISGTPTTEGSSAATLTVTDGSFTTSSTLQLTFTADPTLPVINSPSSASLTPGQFFSYTINAPSSAGPSDPTIFSAFNTNDLPAGLTFNAATGTISGTYSPSARQASWSGGAREPDLAGGILLGSIQLFATNGHGTSTIELLFLRRPAGVVNISTRLQVRTGDNVLIGGFIITGNAPEVVVIRAIGPSTGIPDALQDPVLELHDPANHVVSNDNWRDSQQDLISATDIPPGDNRESAIVIGLDPGNYTAIVAGKNGATGIALVEVFDLGTGSLDISGLASLANISTRGLVNTGDNAMIGGFIIRDQATRVLVRAIGPSLSASGIQGALPDTVLELHDGSGSLIFSNDDWRSTQEQEIIATGIPPTDNRESAIVADLVPGAYTAVVRGQANTTGVALVEVYRLP